MSLREIKIVSSTRNGAKTIYSEAVTWGQLKEGLSEFGDVNKLSAVVKETKNSLTVDEALLPTGDFTLYLAPKQIKAGTSREVAILEDLRDRFVDSVNEVIESIEDGDFDHLDSAKKGAKTSEVTSEDKNFLSKLAGI